MLCYIITRDLFSLCQKESHLKILFSRLVKFSLSNMFMESDILVCKWENMCILVKNFCEMYSIPCNGFVWLSKPQLQARRVPEVQSAEIEISGAPGMSVVWGWGCACIYRWGCQHHAAVSPVKVDRAFTTVIKTWKH